MFNFSEYPFIRLVLWLVCGILLVNLIPENIALVLIILSSVTWWLVEKFNGFNFIPGLLVLFLGVLVAHSVNYKNKANSVYALKDCEVTLSGNIEGEVKEIEETKRFVLTNLVLVGNTNYSQSLRGKILVRACGLTYNPLHGDEVILKAKLTPFNPPFFDELFNYSQFMERQQIYLQANVDREKIMIITAKNFNIRRMAILLKNQIQHWFSLYLSKDASGLAIALITGEDSQIENPIIEAFKNTGTMHLLAVSGMHVGLIFLLLNMVFNRFKKIRVLKIFLDLFTLCAIWLFCLVAGLSDSVIRAGSMITFVIIGHVLNKKSNSLNHLFASVFFMLIYNPNYLYNIGFQLSVCAVLGILLFYQPIKKSLAVSNQWVNKIIDLLALSLAAQLGTFAISIFYFNQFPNWFLLCNVLLVPLASLIIYGSLILLIVSPLKWLAIKIGWLVSFLIKFFCKTLLILNSLPFIVSAPLVLSPIQVFVLLGMVALFYLIIVFKRYSLIKYKLILIVVFLALGIKSKYDLHSTSSYYFLASGTKPLIVQRNGKNLTVFSGRKWSSFQQRIFSDYALKKSIDGFRMINFNSDINTTFFRVRNKTLVNEKGLFTINKNLFKFKCLTVLTAKTKKQKSYAVMAYFSPVARGLNLNSYHSIEIK